MIDIKDISGQVRFSTPINKGAKGKFTLMKEDYIILPFSVPSPIPFKLGDYVDLAGVLDDFLGGKLAKIYEIVDLQKPTYNTSTGGYDYELRLDAYYWKWKNKIFKYTPEQAGSEASWSLTAALDVQLGVFLRNLKALGYTYRGTDFTFSIDSTVENKAVSMTYDNMNLLDALFSMAGEDKWNCDCWITDNVIHFGRNEFGDAVKIERGVEASAITRSESQGTYATRIYAFGSTRNIPTSYRPTDEQAVINGVVQKRLMLPADTPYIDAYEGMSQEEAIEDVVVFDDVYPRRIGTLSDVHTRTEEVENEDGTTETVTYYRYKDTGLEFKEEYILEGQELKIRFQSGKLNGMEFGVIFNPSPKDETRGEQLWEIVRNEDYGRPLPDDTMYPADGDQYILSGFDIQLVSDQYIPEAEQELKEKAQKYADKVKKDDGTYPTTLSSSWVKEDLISRTFEFGQRINLVDDTYFENGRISRVLGWEMNLDIPWDSPIYTIGESMPYSRIGEIEDKVDSLTYKGQTYTGSGGSSVYVIKVNDSTPASDSNVFSALRSLAMFLRKDKDDTASGIITFLKGLLSDNIQSRDFTSGPLGTGFVVKRDPKTGKSYIEADEIYIRLKAYFDSLQIKHLTHVGGRFVGSPASMKCTRVEVISGESETLFDSAGSQLFDIDGNPLSAVLAGGEQVYRCYFNNTDGERTIYNEFEIDDLAQCREFNVKTGTSEQVSNQYYWRRVVGLGEDYIDLSITDCDSGSTEPRAGDEIVTIGNKTNPERQHVFYLSAYDDDAPSFKLYSGINSYSMLNKEISVISPNADKNLFTGKVVIKPGSVGFGNLKDAPDMAAIEAEINDAKNDAANAQEAASDAKEDVSDLKVYVDGAFSDGIITEAEAKAIATYINTVENTSQAVAKTYSELYNNSYLEGSAKVSLSNSHATFVSYKDALLNAIETAIADGKTTTAEKDAVDKAFASYNTAYASLSTAIETANKSIQDKLKGYSDNAQKAADEAKNNAAQAMEDVNEAKNAVSDLNDYVDGAFSDGIISEAEAKAISTYINTVTATKKEVDATYTTLYNNSYLTGTAKSQLYSAKYFFDTATTNLITAIQSAIADGKTTSSEKSNVDSKFSSFNTSYANLATAVETANKAIQDKIKEESVNESSEKALAEIEKVSENNKNNFAKQLGYTSFSDLEAAAERGETVIQGGMINTSLINAAAIVTSQLIAQAIRTNTLNVNDKFIVRSDGSVDMNGIFHSLGSKTELVMSDGFARIMYNGQDVAKLSVDENTGMPQLSLYKGSRSCVITAEKIMMGTGPNSFLQIDPSVIGTGIVKKNSDGFLVMDNQTTEIITVGIIVSPSNSGTTRPSPSTLHLVNKGETETVEAIPYEGYQFDRWSDGGSQKHDVTWTYAGQSITAFFTKIPTTNYTVTLKSSPTDGGTTSGGGTFEKGTVKTISATPNSGFRFVKWSDGGYQNHSVTWDSNKTITAYFEAYSVTGDEIFSGTDLTSKDYWTAYGEDKVSLVIGGIGIFVMSGDVSGNSYIAFNKGYLGGKLEQGHVYLLTFQIMASASTYLVAQIGSSMDNGLSSDGIIYGEELPSGSFKTMSLYITADKRDSTVSDAFIFTVTSQCNVSIKNISLKEA